MNHADSTTYKGVVIRNVRNAGTGSDKIMSRNIAVTYLADRWQNGGDAERWVGGIKHAQAMIDWMLSNGAEVINGRIVCMMDDFDTCEFGCSTRGIVGYSKFMKGGK
jgi:hypothetical protein